MSLRTIWLRNAKHTYGERKSKCQKNVDSDQHLTSTNCSKIFMRRYKSNFRCCMTRHTRKARQFIMMKCRLIKVAALFVVVKRMQENDPTPTSNHPPIPRRHRFLLVGLSYPRRNWCTCHRGTAEVRTGPDMGRTSSSRVGRVGE